MHFYLCCEPQPQVADGLGLQKNPLWLCVDIMSNPLVDYVLSDDVADMVNVSNDRSFHWAPDLLKTLKM